MAIVKKDLIDIINKEIGLTKIESDEIVNLFFDTIKKTVLNDEEVKLAGFGNFTKKHKKARPARNPKTGEYAEVSERNIVAFKISGKMRKAIQLEAEL